MAVVGPVAADEVPVCDLVTVRNLARGGHVYEQNQLGIASILAIAPGLDTGTARGWFEKAAQKGYAPAEVNLGVLHANGWGVPQNYAKALYWFNRA
ncbi:MAG: tetratricopeptide repeat protein, partial [Acidobacteriaceae bacterium]